MKFLVDQMLGTLAKWLRLFGFDTYYATQEISDDELLKIAKKEQRVLITRDKELHLRAKKKKISTIFTQSISLSEQLHLVFQSYPKIIDEINPLSRCSLCNTSIIPIKKEKAQDKVPQRIFQHHSEFWYCPTCKKIYWQGTHFDKILHKINKMKQQYKQKDNLE